MTVTVRLFAILRQRAGRESIELELPDGARVADALAAAGGAAADADLSTVNLARVVVDGEQVVVLRAGEQPTAPLAASAGGGAASGAGSPPAGLVNLNAADVTALDALPGIGPVLAQRIVEHRAEHVAERARGDRDGAG